MISLLYTINEPYFKPMLVSLFSVIKHTNEPINVVNLTYEVPEYNAKRKKMSYKQERFLANFMQKSNPLSHFVNIDVSGLFREKLYKGKNIKTRAYSYLNTVRLLADLIAEVPGRVIYLDSDTVAQGDIKALWGIDLEGYDVAGVRDPVVPYMNAGVILMDMGRIREDASFEKARELLTTRWLHYLDQDAINKACRCKILPKEFECYKYKPNALIHHMLLNRAGKIPFTKKWNHRIKPDEIELVRKHIPEYNGFYDEVEALFKEYDAFEP